MNPIHRKHCSEEQEEGERLAVGDGPGRDIRITLKTYKRAPENVFSIEVLSLPPACLALQLLQEETSMMPRWQDLSPAHQGTLRLTVGVPVLPGETARSWQEQEAVCNGRRVQDIWFACVFSVQGPSPPGLP